ncbi:unnamed protein product [Medioppia subpectinata]|uniref:Uncharacterized protein n=1 Tax=Medioppia subpectinata TaxID=1979941 RepID=A0A7R9QH74_9ACAR|nr:unnamed protein product [Medioppia subpectinata]CAG2119956.1 unnamed protein product [Medioppia subpectinata]
MKYTILIISVALVLAANITDSIPGSIIWFVWSKQSLPVPNPRSRAL